MLSKVQPNALFPHYTLSDIHLYQQQQQKSVTSNIHI